MKVGMISVFDSSGYGHASTELALSMDAVGIDVVARKVKMTNNNDPVHPDIQKMMDKDLKNVGALIQFNLPDQFVYKGGVVNLGCYCYETNSFENSFWRHNLELMDKLLVFCNFQKQVIGNSCSKRLYDNTYVIPCSVDVAKFSKNYPKFDLGPYNNCYKFYTIAEFNKRKNFPALLLSYLSTFDSSDNVVLVIKSSQGSSGPIHQIAEDIRKSIKRFASSNRYPPVVVIDSKLTEDQLCSLHQTCNCFVTASHGESICLPSLDSLGFGNPVIAPKHGAFLDYIPKNDSNGYLIDGMESIVSGVENSPNELYTGNEKWFNINTHHMACLMDLVYKSKIINSEPDRAERKQFILDNFNRTVVGNKIKEILNAI